MAIISYTRNNAYITLMCWLNKTKNFILCTHARIIQHHMRNTYGRTKQCIWTMRAHNGTHNTGYYAEHIADNKDIKDNVTVPVRSETRGINLHNLSYAGPIVMGFGGNFRFLFNWIYIASHLLHTIYVYAREVCEMKVKWWMWCGGWTHIVAHASYLRATNFHHNWDVCRVLTLNFVSKLMFLLKIWFIVFVGGFYVLIGMNREGRKTCAERMELRDSSLKLEDILWNNEMTPRRKSCASSNSISNWKSEVPRMTSNASKKLRRLC